MVAEFVLDFEGDLCLCDSILWFYLFVFPNELTKLYGFRKVLVACHLGPLKGLENSYPYEP